MSQQRRAAQLEVQVSETPISSRMSKTQEVHEKNVEDLTKSEMIMKKCEQYIEKKSHR